jgi:hypothetical protein
MRDRKERLSAKAKVWFEGEREGGGATALKKGGRETRTCLPDALER